MCNFVGIILWNKDCTYFLYDMHELTEINNGLNIYIDISTLE